MQLRARLLTIVAAALAAIPLTVLGPAVASHAAATPSVKAPAHSCATAKAGFAACKAIVRTDLTPLKSVAPLATPSGYGPSSLQSAYNLPSSSAGSGQTVYVVDAYNDPNAESDLGVYRSQYGLSACTTANGCFTKLNQNGATSPLPSNNTGWAEEISLDIDMVSAICPNCHILLVEASSASFASLGAAVNRAATMGANAISNSYG